MNIKQSFRILFRSKTYSLLNIACLAVGIACAALVLLWIEEEVSFDKFPKSKNLYYVFLNFSYDGNQIRTREKTSALLAVVVKNEVSGVKRVSRVEPHYNLNWELGENIFSEAGGYVDSTFFSIFDLQFLFGNKEMAFNSEHSVVISKSMSSKLFGNVNPVGQMLRTNNRDFRITGVYSDIRKNSSFNFDWIVPFEIQGYDNNIDINQWYVSSAYTIVELEKNVNPAALNEQINQIPSGLIGEISTFFLYPFNRKHLYGQFVDGMETEAGYIVTIRTITWLGLIILLIACINFTNLATARSQKRTLEVGVRKTFGASRFKMITQFMAESALITFFAIVMAIFIIILALPFYNNLIDKQLLLNLGKIAHLGGLFGVGLLTCLLAGSYPAFYMSSFPSIDMLKRLKTKNSGELTLRNVLVVFQFSASLVLIVCTMFIYLQLRHAQKRPLGMNIEQVLTINISDDIRNNFAPFRNSMLSTGVVSNIALSGTLMLQIDNASTNMSWSGKPEDFTPLIRFSTVGAGIISTLGIELLEGRDFDDSLRPFGYMVIITESLAEMMGDEGRIGGRILHQGHNAEIIGIVKNLVFNDMYTVNQEPLVLWYAPERTNLLFIRLQSDNMQVALSRVGAVVQQFSPTHSFGYQFMDENFNRFFQNEQFASKLTLLFASLAILISCLGLFGLTAFSVEQRTREIGIRKVLGASVWSIIQLLGRNFLFLIVISFFIAIPSSWYIVNNYWLNNFAYRIETSWTVFAGACLLVTFIAMLTVCSIALKAAMADPVKAIKSE